MAELILVRHGQASAFEADYDKLSELGHRQARLLGEHWAQRGVLLDTVITGSLRRHRETLAGVRDAFVSAGLPFPRVEEDAGWDEFDAYALIGRLGPMLAEQDASFSELWRAAQEAMSGPARNRYFQRAFEALMEAWVTERVASSDVESFAHFHNRVMTARAQLLSRSGAGRVAVFTSGGPIGVNVQATMEAPLLQSMHVNARVRNASLTHFLFSKDRVSFDRFNLVPHLEHDHALVTFR